MTVMSSVKLQEIMATSRGSVDPSKSPSEVFDLYSIPAFDRGDPEVVPGSAIGSTKQVVQPNDVLLSKIVPHIRRAWVVGQEQGRRMIASSEWIVFRNKRFHPSYLRHLLTSDRFHTEFMATVSGVGGSLLRARPSNVAKITIPLPPLPEQKRIAAILDQADAIRRKRQQACGTVADLIPSVFSEFFGNPTTNPRGWPTCTLGNLLDHIDSGWSPSCEDRPVVDGEWGVLKLGAVTYCEYNDAANKALPVGLVPRPEIEVKPGDLLFTRKNTYELVAACALVRKTRPKLLLPDLIFRLQFKQDAPAVPEYLWQLLIHPGQRAKIQKLAGGSAGSMPNISKQRLATVDIVLPPLRLQQEFAAIVRASLDMRDRMRAIAVPESELLFDALVQRAFRGEL